MATTDARDLYNRFLLGLWQAAPAELERLAAEVVGPDFVVHQARPGSTSEDLRGPAAAVRLVRQGTEPFDDVKVTVEVGPVAEGDLVAARWRFDGVYRGGLPGVPADAGTPVSFGGNDIVRIAGDRVVEYWVSSDQAVFESQLGLR